MRMRSTQRPDTLVQDPQNSNLTDFSCNAPPVHTFGSGAPCARWLAICLE